VSGAIVLGGSGTVGREVCRALLQRGMPVGFTWCANAEVAAELTREGAVAEQLDVRDVAAIDRVLHDLDETLGGTGSFVNCAATSGSTSLGHALMDDVDAAAWDDMVAINTRSSFFAVQRVSSFMRARGGGNIVLLGSIDGVKPAPSPVHYAASKGALAGMVKAMAKELGPHNVRVNSVAPGVLERGLSRALPEELRQEYLKHCGLKRLGRVEEVVGLVAWLATENTFVTGQTVIVDGAL
jgi:NAD(P)-dependent dehydrogenase (short-subunit alcohol dehydrogenase family)